MAPILSKIASKLDQDPKFFTIASSLALGYWIYSVSKTIKSSQLASKKEVKFVITDPNNKGQSKKVQVDAQFFRSIKRILGILIPKWYSKETGFLLMVAAALFFRSFCDIWMINNATHIESAIISQNLQGFKKNLGTFFMAMPAISLVNNLLKFSLQELKLRFRIRLTDHLYDKYLREFTYYKMSNLDNRISNADQLLTQDVEKFCDSVVDFYSNVNKPLLDIIIYVRRLTETIGLQGPSVMIMYLLMAGLLLTHIRKPIGKLTAEEQKLEGEFRFVNSRLITNSEEIAFYQGNLREKLNVDSSFGRLVKHLRKLIGFKFNMGFIDNIVAKYYAFCVGFSVVAYPFLKKNSPYTAMSHQEKMKEYYINGRMLVKLAEAIGRLVLAGRELTRLSGYTSRVQELITVLNDLGKGHYQRTMVDQVDGSQTLIPGAGKIVEADNIIRFEKVPLVTPNGDVLVKELNFEVKSGMNVLVCGPNGCGKSSLFRILGELWPAFGGVVTKPASGKLFYIPQRPYMTLGTLRDQVIYPDSHEDMLRKGLTDEYLTNLMDKVHLNHILDRENGLWDAVADWIDVLSGGEKQRVAMARLFYHRPQFAILDECTSAVSVDVEGEMYKYCRSVGITLFTVSHRKSLWKHHEYFLRMDGRGSFEFGEIDEKTLEFGS